MVESTLIGLSVWRYDGSVSREYYVLFNGRMLTGVRDMMEANIE